MRIHIEGDLFVSGDRLGYTIERKQVIKEGKTAGTESYVAIGHYSQLKNAIKDLTKMKVADSTASTLNELLQEINRYHGEIEAKVLI